jgi:hypothetical protein
MPASRADVGSLGKMQASDEAKAHEASDVDAMGQDKRRQVVGQGYGPSRKSQVVFAVVVAAILVVGIGGYALAIAAFDQPSDDYPDVAKWKDNTIPTRPPSGPCGEPGNPYPPPADSPCAPGGIKAEASGKDVSDEKAVEKSGATGAQ